MNDILTPKDLIRIAICQLNSVDDLAKNVSSIKSMLSGLTEIDLVCLPENCLYFRVKEGELIEGIEPNNPLFEEFATLAKRNRLNIHFGASPLKVNGVLRNSSVFISDKGEIAVSYDKIHLFDIELTGQKPVRESDVFKGGDRPVEFGVGGWRFGQTICYDLRFSELFNYYGRRGVHVLLVPAAFLVPTGKAHWEVLLRARAIENQCYVIAAAQAGRHHGKAGGERMTWGHSMVVGPWGDVLIQMNESEVKAQVFELKLSEITKVRTQIPMAQHRRSADFYCK